MFKTHLLHTLLKVSTWCTQKGFWNAELEQVLEMFTINPFQSNLSATHILPSFYLFRAGKKLVGYL
jgi:hypothetical protein